MTNKEFKEDISEHQYFVNLKYIPKPRTIDDLECGDYVVDKDRRKRRCLGVCGEICFLGEYNDIYVCPASDDDKKAFWFQVSPHTKNQLKKYGYTLYQEPTPTDDTIEIEGVKYKASEVKEALKNFKNKN